MKVKVVGTRFVSGTSKKNNKPFQGFFVSYTHEVRGYTGQRAGEGFFSTELLIGQVPSVGDTMVIDYDSNGYAVSVDIISANKPDNVPEKNLNGNK